MRLETSRILLRPWTNADLIPFRALNADPVVMRFFPSVLRAEESDALASSIRQKMDANGFGLWALELPGITSFAGFVGLNIPSFDASLTEVGWRLHKNFWGHGYATEAAAAALEAAFTRLNLLSVCAFTAVINIPSEKVMQRLGMEHSIEDDFNHPALPADHPLSRHVLYRMTKSRWESQRKAFPALSTLRILP